MRPVLFQLGPPEKLSSSAAFEVMVGNILNYFYNDGKVDNVEIAKMAQFSENEIREIVNKVIGSMDTPAQSGKEFDSTQYCGRKFIGIFDDMNKAIEAANNGYKAAQARFLLPKRG